MEEDDWGDDAVEEDDDGVVPKRTLDNGRVGNRFLDNVGPLIIGHPFPEFSHIGGTRDIIGIP